MSALPLEDAFPEAVHTFKRWLGASPRDRRCTVVCHVGADGLAAGALFGRALPFLGFTDVAVSPSRRDAAAVSDAARQGLPEHPPGSVVVTGLGVSGPLEPDASGAPVLFVDHHRPGGAPEAFVVTAYDWEPVPCSASLAYRLLEAAAPDVDELRELDWIAAIGLLSGRPTTSWPMLADARRRHTEEALTEATRLIEAAGDARAPTALGLLMAQDGPKALAEAPEAMRLRET